MSTVSLNTAAQPLWFIDSLARVHIDGEQTAEAYCLTELAGRRDAMPPLHVHHRDDETFYVLEGELTLFLGGRQIQVGAGPRRARAARRPARLPGRVRAGTLARDQQPSRV
jgi:mannose-6-phosphate isomerase-like protein (cupin superfamily)